MPPNRRHCDSAFATPGTANRPTAIAAVVSHLFAIGNTPSEPSPPRRDWAGHEHSRRKLSREISIRDRGHRGLEMALKVLPAAGRGGIKRPANLPAAGRADAPVGLGEVQDSIVPLKPSKL